MIAGLIAAIAVATLVLIVIGGIYFAAHLPRHAPLGLPVALLVAAGVCLVFNAVSLARLRAFPWRPFKQVGWRPFKQVGGWALLAYAVIAGMLEYVFLYDHVSGSQLVVLTLMLVVFAADVPLLLAFSVARYQEMTPSE